MEEYKHKSRSEVAKRAGTEDIEVTRKARNEEIANAAHISVDELNGLQMLPNDPNGEAIDAMEGTVNGVEFKGHMDKDGMHHVTLDGVSLPEGDARQAYEHIDRVIKLRDHSNNAAILNSNVEISHVDLHEPRISAIRDKFWGGSSPDHEGFSEAA
jgi:hypothetical protein